MRKQFSTVLIAVLLVVSVIGLSGCSMRPFQEGNADVSVTVRNAFWSQAGSGAERFLLPGDDTVYLEVRKGTKDGSLVTSATGKLITESLDGYLRSYSVIPLTRLPLYVDLFITAETRRGGEAVSRATAPLRIDDAKFEGMFLSLLPLPTHPDLADFSDGMALSLSAGESRILRFTPPTTEGSFNWPTAGTADMFFQIRDGEGSHVPSGKLPDISGTTGCMYFPIGSGSPWYLVLHNAGATAITGITLTSTNAVTLSYNLSFNANGGTGTIATQSRLAGEVFNLPSNTFTRAGYSFAGWSTTAGGSVEYLDGELYTMLPTNVTLYAVWTAQTFNLVFNNNGGLGSMTTLAVNAGQTITLPLNTFTRSGFMFLGWSLNASDTSASYSDGGDYVMGTSDTTLYAIWISNTGVLSFNANGGTGTMASESRSDGEVFNLPSNTFTRAGYSFAGWSTTAGGSVEYLDGASFTMPATSTILYAVWSNTLTVAIDFSTPTLPAFLPVGPYIVSSTGSVSLAVGTGTEGYTGYQWLLNGTALTGQTSYNCTINLASQGPLIHIGINRVTVIVQIGGAYYSAFVDISITE